MNTPNVETLVNITVEGFTAINRALTGAKGLIVGGLPTTFNSLSQAEINYQMVGANLSAQETIGRIRQQSFGPPHFVCYLTTPARRTEDYQTFIEAGYNYVETEHLMGLALAPENLPPKYSLPQSLEIRPLSQPAEVELLNKMRPGGDAVTCAAHIADPAVHFYYLAEPGNQQPICRAALVYLPNNMCFVSRVFTLPAYRQRNLAHYLMTELLHKASQDDIIYSVLSSTEIGHQLYQKLGYADLWTELIFSSK